MVDLGGGWDVGSGYVGVREWRVRLCRSGQWLGCDTGTRREARSRGGGEEKKDEEEEKEKGGGRRGEVGEQEKQQRRGGRRGRRRRQGVMNPRQPICRDIKKRFIDHFIDLSRRGRGKKI